MSDTGAAGRCFVRRTRLPAWGETAVDALVFRLQQRALGQAVVVPQGDPPRSPTYPEFLERLAGPEFVQHVKPVEELVRGVNPDLADGRWERLKHVLD